MIYRQASKPRAPIPLALAGLLAGTLLVGYLVGDDRQLILAGLFGIVPLLIATLWSFERIVLAIPLAALFVTYSLPTGTESRVSAVMLLVMMLSGIWLVTALFQHTRILVRSPLNVPLLGFVAICTLSLLWSMAFRDPLLIRYDKFIVVQLGALATMVLSPLATLLIGNFVRTPRQLWWIAGLFLGAGVLVTGTYFAGIDLRYINTRGLFPLWFMAIGYAIVVAHPGLRTHWRIALLIVLCVYGYIVGFVAISWLSGWFPALVGIVAITFLRSRIAFLALALLLVLVIATQWNFLYTHVVEHSEAEGDFERLTLWDLNLELLRNRPVLGTGPAGYALYYVTYHPHEARSTHNGYLDLLAQTGIIGTLCFGWLIVAGFREARAVLRHAPPGVYRTLGLAASGGLVGALAGMALGDWVIPFAYNQGIDGYRYTIFSWIFLGVLISIRHQVAPIAERTKRKERVYAPRTA
jgi:O-antigen ligase